ncbi:STAS/SEC14 domain-containing protein [Rubritalea marina]|uniref:STAS/SEC14 domain-containing protein n=1 Tax=Rubritalea marina TaxID=361055 RepID=UPI0003A85B35|nr:STAS/SEC14 domain-containing protein [Rubritalea marina]
MNDGSVVFELNGAPDAVDMENILQQMSELSEGKQGMTMLYKISCFEIPSASAMMVKLSDLPRWIGVMKAFKKMAIVTEKAWIRNVAELEGFLIRGLEIKSFEFDEIHQAEAWLDEG